MIKTKLALAVILILILPLCSCANPASNDSNLASATPSNVADANTSTARAETPSHTSTMMAYNNGDLHYLDIDNVDSTQSQNLVIELENNQVSQFSISPDGQQVAFTYEHMLPSPLYIAKVGGTPRKIVDNIGFFISWSPDSRWLVYQPIEVNGQDVFGKEVYVTRANGTDNRRLLPANRRIRSIDWTPDGQNILYYEYREGTNPCCGRELIGDTFIVPFEGGEPQLFIKDLQLLAWSPNGQLALMQKSYPEGPSELYVVTRDGLQIKPLGKGHARSGLGVWLPDSSAVLLYDNGTIYLANVNDGTRRVILQDNVGILYRLTLDGTRLIYGDIEWSEAEQRNIRWETRIIVIDGKDDRLLMNGIDNFAQLFAGVSR